MSYQVTIEPVGEKLEVKDDQTILDAILRAGLYIPYQCNHGLCSTCKITILEGEVDYGAASPFALLDFEREEGRALACCAKPLSDLVVEADIEQDPDSRNITVTDHDATVAEVVDYTPDIKGVFLEVAGAGLDFQAGQYINLNLPGIDGARAFSIASSPSSPTRIELQVRRVAGGQGTTYVHDRLKAGDKLTFAGPMGHFFVRKSADVPLIFIAGGSGLSSPKSMIMDLLEEGFDKPIWLFHGVRTQKDIYCGDLFRGLADRHSNFTYVAALSQPQPDDGWTGETGFIHEVAERRFDGKFAGHKAYLCGPPMMIEACIRTLMKGRLFEKDIYTEKFVTQADGEAALTRSPLFKKI